MRGDSVTRLAALLLLTPLAALAHPHAWIDLHVNLDLDAEQRITAVSQTWVFDPVYTLLLVEEFEQELADAGRQEQLDALGQRMLHSMAAYDYLTRIRHGGARVGTGTAENMHIRLNDDDQLEFRFSLPLSEPIPLDGEALEYTIFDPTYYIEMLHPSPDAVAVNGPDNRCQVDIVQPSPTPAQIARAAAVDLGAASADGLGEHFAQRVRVRCQPTARGG
ncbi:MAG: DUF1007 family protein [Ectothiorhodospiraceae bacterium]|nr:DUF1007 family protein [Ectothiorhodospiraceae bacterium]